MPAPMRICVCLVSVVCLSCLAALEPPMVTVPKQGTLMGKLVSMIRTQRIFVYLGIPYVSKPARFAPPDMNDLPAWEGVRNATEFEPACMQIRQTYEEEDTAFLNLLPDPMFAVSEDCLYLNVFVPYGQPPPEGFAVMVWIHPGNFKTGNPAQWNPYTIVFKQRVIVVTIAYRLNILGFFTTGTGEAAGNYGLLDQVAALNWIKNNIELFGGNPNSICLMGYGAGAVSIGVHMVSSLSKGLFTKAIAMSGNFLVPSAVNYPQDQKSVADQVVKYFGCVTYSTQLLMDCLRNAKLDTLVDFGSKFDWKPLVDQGLSNNSDPFLAEQPRNYFERGDFNQVPFLTGYTDMEDVLKHVEILRVTDDTDDPNEYLMTVLSDFVSRDLPEMNASDSCVYNHDHILDSVMFFYRPQPPSKSLAETRKILTDFITERTYGSATYLLAQYVSKYKPTFVYRFDIKPSTDGATAELPSWVTVPHHFDLIYMWGMPYWVQLRSKQEWDYSDKKVSDIIMNFWTNFAKSSNPTDSSIFAIRWDQFTPDNPGILIIDRAFNMSDPVHLNYKAFDFWNNYYPKVINIATQCCNATSIAVISEPASLFSILFVIICLSHILYITNKFF